MIADGRRKTGILLPPQSLHPALDILPEEIPLQRELELAISGTLRDGLREQDVARTIRFLCKQGAPLSAMEEVLQASMIVYLSASAKGALADMYYMLPKWMECREGASFQ